MIHTPEPWHVDSEDRSCVTDDMQNKYIPVSGAGWIALAEFACDIDGDVPGTPTGKANAARVVACVNACAGINPDAVPDMLAALKWVATTLEAQKRLGTPMADAVLAAIAKAQQ